MVWLICVNKNTRDSPNLDQFAKTAGNLPDRSARQNCEVDPISWVISEQLAASDWNWSVTNKLLFSRLTPPQQLVDKISVNALSLRYWHHYWHYHDAFIHTWNQARKKNVKFLLLAIDKFNKTITRCFLTIYLICTVFDQSVVERHVVRAGRRNLHNIHRHIHRICG